MGKISIVSRRRQDKRFPETAAQQRARVRELRPVDTPTSLQTSGTPALPGAEDFLAYSAALLDNLATPTMPEVTSTPESVIDNLTGSLPGKRDATVRLELSPEQSQAIAALTRLAKTQHQPLRLDLREWHAPQHTVLQFSLHADAVPDMLSLQDLCQQLKVGRRSVMRLIREGQLRCYRIGKRYRFAASEVQHYLEQISSQEL
jgi:excisionase family DNA binding protein